VEDFTTKFDQKICEITSRDNDINLFNQSKYEDYKITDELKNPAMDILLSNDKHLIKDIKHYINDEYEVEEFDKEKNDKITFTHFICIPFNENINVIKGFE